MKDKPRDTSTSSLATADTSPANYSSDQRAPYQVQTKFFSPDKDFGNSARGEFKGREGKTDQGKKRIIMEVILFLVIFPLAIV